MKGLLKMDFKNYDKAKVGGYRNTGGLGDECAS
jgi:hypothetical protein